jgi:predicted amidophosphoribosyltransferase
MTLPTRHRREIWSSLCIGYDAVSGLLWQEAIDANQPVGTCSRCGQFMRPLDPDKVGQRVVYPARCAGCGREVEGMGARPERPKKGAA